MISLRIWLQSEVKKQPASQVRVDHSSDACATIWEPGVYLVQYKTESQMHAKQLPHHFSRAAGFV